MDSINSRFYLNNTFKKIPLPPKQAPEYFDDIGDSDDDEIIDYITTADESKLQIRKFDVDGSVKAEHTTFIASDGKLKGDQLIKICHEIVQSACKGQHTDKGFDFDDLHSVHFDDEEVNYPEYQFTKKSDWVFNLGILANFIPTTEMQATVRLNNLKVREKGISLAMTYEGTERMSLSSAFIGRWNQYFSDSKFSRADLRYTDINKANQFVIEFLSDIDNEFSDCSLAELQIQRLKFEKPTTMSKKIVNFFTASEENKSQINLILKYLDFLNALIFGLEASRVNATLITGVMTLELIQAGHLTYQEAFFQNANWGGQFPLATIGSGSNNLKARSLLLKTNDAGMAHDRCYPKWLAITCKESIVIKNWFNMQLATPTQNFSKAEVIEKFTALIKQLIDEYY